MPRDCTGARKDGENDDVASAGYVPTSSSTGKKTQSGDMIGELAEQDLGLGPEVVFVVENSSKGAWSQEVGDRALLRCKGSGRIRRLDQQRRTTVWFETSSRSRIVRGLR